MIKDFSGKKNSFLAKKRKNMTIILIINLKSLLNKNSNIATVNVKRKEFMAMMTTYWLKAYQDWILQSQSQWLNWQKNALKSWGNVTVKTKLKGVEQKEGAIVKYQAQADGYGVGENSHGSIKLYEERLLPHKAREKVGEVVLGKTVTSETSRVSVSVEKERVLVKRNRHMNIEQPVTPDEAKFWEEEVARVEVYEENANIYKQAFVREEVMLEKAVEFETVTAEDVIRREELKVHQEGNAVIEDYFMEEHS